MRISDWSSDVCSSDLSELMEAAAADIEFAAGRFQVSGTDRSVTLFEVAAFAAGRGEALAAEADFVTTEEAHPSGRSEEHTSELQSLMRISYAVFCLKKKNKERPYNTHSTYFNIKR